MTGGAGDSPGRSPGAGPDWRSVDALFSELLDVAPEARAAILVARCGEDSELRAAVQRLLDAEARSAGLFESAAPAIGRMVEEALAKDHQSEPLLPAALRQLGPYRLVSRIGVGGMSVVWLARRSDGEFEQLVAVKLLRHWMDGDEAVRRFRAERQILSSLAHPNICALIDGGTTDDGTPWLATEYVDGQPLTHYCEAGELPVERRLDLFLQVADAVHHAHQKLVIHRDLKPSNILVEADGRVRLLDFGIAKLLEPDPDAPPLTRTGFHLMTPEYAAPEQLLGAPVTTATDVYQLGVLLYELLCGVRPMRGGGTTTLATTGGGPPRPSVIAARRGDHRLAARLRGDLDVIIMRALHEEPANRYASVATLAEDLRNYLRGRAISARRDTPLETLHRFARRNPLAAGGALLAAAALIGLLVTLQLSGLEVARERDAAQREAARATQVRDLLVDLFRQADPMAPEALRGRETTIWESVEAATKKVRAELSSDPETRAEILATLAMLHHYAGRLAEGAELLEEALALHREHMGPGSAPYAVTLAELGRHWRHLGRMDDAGDAIGEALAVIRGPAGADRQALMAVLLDAGDVQRSLGLLDDAERSLREAVALAESGAPGEPSAALAASNGLAQVLLELNRTAEAEAFARQSIEVVENTLGADHPRLVVPLSIVAHAQRSLGRPEHAVVNFRRGLEILEREYGPAYDSTVSMRNNLALALAAAGQPDLAAGEMRILLAQRRAAYGEQHPEVGGSLQNLAVMLVIAEEYEEALPILAEARQVYAASLPPEHFRNAFPLLTEAYVHLRRRDAELAEATALEALEILRIQLPEQHFAIGFASCLVGESMLLRDDAPAASDWLSRALPLAETGPASLLPYLANCREAHASAVEAVRLAAAH
jgi:eukaryotic-like serine/threonine-protein kinase